MAPSTEDKAKAVELKNQGNEAFKKHDWPAAIESYSKAIELDDTEPAYYSNRAQVTHPPTARPRPRTMLARTTDQIPSHVRPISRPKHTATRFKTRQRQSS